MWEARQSPFQRAVERQPARPCECILSKLPCVCFIHTYRKTGIKFTEIVSYINPASIELIIDRDFFHCRLIDMGDHNLPKLCKSLQNYESLCNEALV